jgi:alkaline phosphatase D
MKHRIFILLLVLFRLNAWSQISWGPMLGYLEAREVKINVGFGKNYNAPFDAQLVYWEKDNPIKSKQITNGSSKPNDIYTVVSYVLPELKMGTTYEYQIEYKKKKIGAVYSFKTKFDWWQKNLPAPDFSFVLASCFYVNDSIYDRAGRPYGQKKDILNTIANAKADFMIWGGDNLYLRDPDLTSESGLEYRFEKNTTTPEFQKLFAARPNYALWDDHDFGPNDGDKTYELKHKTLELFKTYWANKTYGEDDNDGIYGRFSWYDCEFFIIDDRYHRSPNEVKDSLDGKPNAHKSYLGTKQLDWLKNSLLNSKATFKFIVNGNQVLNPKCEYECFRNYSYEMTDLLSHIKSYNVNGVLFLSGDRHHSEVIKIDNIVNYPLYDVTASAATSGTHKLAKNEENNPYRISNTHVEENNFGLLSVSGKKNERVFKIEFIDKDGISKANFSISEKELKVSK